MKSILRINSVRVLKKEIIFRFSTAPPAVLTKEQLEEEQKNVQKQLKINLTSGTLQCLLHVSVLNLLVVAPTTEYIKFHSNGDASLPENLAELAVLTGMPDAQQNREVFGRCEKFFSSCIHFKVIIQLKPRKSQQSGDKFGHIWEICWKQQPKWENSLMGWTSGSDPMHTVKVVCLFCSSFVLCLLMHYLS